MKFEDIKKGMILFCDYTCPMTGYRYHSTGRVSRHEKKDNSWKLVRDYGGDSFWIGKCSEEYYHFFNVSELLKV